MPTFRYVLADVFTDTPLEGNGLAVFTDARELPEETLQPLARELNLSETVYVYPAEAGGHARIRIFTPMDELPFAGHPVLGTAFVLAAPLQLPEIVLETGKGPIPVRLEREEDRISFGWMSQPIPTVEPFAAADELLAAVGVESSELPVEVYDNGARHVYVALPSVEAVEALEPDLQALKRLQGIVGTNCFAGEGDRWKTRMFAPADGVPEDPATGSAAGPLACHLARHGRISFGDGDRHLAGGRDPAPEHAARPGHGLGGEDRGRGRRRLGGHRRPRRVQARLGPGDVADLGQLDRDRAPEDAAVPRHVDAVPGRVEDVVRALAERDGRARGQPGAALAPRAAAVVGDHERRTAVQEEDDGRAHGVDVQRLAGGPGRREVERPCPFHRGSFVALEELVAGSVITDLDRVDAVVAADLRPHAASSARTTSPASRAAERGL